MGSTMQPVPFGHAMLKQFPLDPNYKNLNHGSFGTFPISVRDKFREFQDELEGNPDKFIRYKETEHLAASRKGVAEILRVPQSTVVFVKNASTGVDTVLRSLVYKPGDVIVYFSTVFEAVEKMIAHLAETTPLQARKVVYEFPISHEELVRKFIDVVRKAKGEGLNVKLAVFDIVVSVPGLRFPFERLVEVCREEGILTCVDGAHGIGHVKLDLSQLDPDFFVSNCHKWLFTPRGCSTFYVPQRNQHLIRSALPTARGFNPVSGILAGSTDHEETQSFAQYAPPIGTKSSFERLFEHVATADNIPYLCIPAALKFRNEVCGGEDIIMKHCETLAHEAGNLVAGILRTDVLGEPGAKNNLSAPTTHGISELRRCALANVRLPLAIDDGRQDSADSIGVTPASSSAVIKAQDVDRVCAWILHELVFVHNTMVPTFLHAGCIYVRLSAQIYLELDDFKWLGTVLKGLCDRVAAGEAVANVKVS